MNLGAATYQCYRPRRLSSFADLENDLLRPLLLMPLGQLAANADEFAEFVFRPEPQPIPMLWRTIWRAFRIRAMPPFVFD